MLLELYRPKSLKDYVGQGHIVQIAVQWMNAWTDRRPMTKGLLLHGSPGTGKTTLARCLAADYKVPLLLKNLSLERDVNTLRDLRSSAQAGTLGKATGIRLIVLDEADSLTSAGWKQIQALLEESRSPVVLTCNYVSQVPKEVKQLCTQVFVPPPTEADLREVASRVLATDPEIQVTSGEVAELCKRAPSFRTLINALSTNSNILEFKGSTDDKETLVKSIFQGRIGRGDIKGHEVQQIFPWVYDNTQDWDAVAEVDYFQAARRRVGMPMHKYVVGALVKCRGDKVRFPWSLGALARAAREKEPKDAPARASKGTATKARAPTPAAAVTPPPKPPIRIEDYL